MGYNCCLRRHICLRRTVAFVGGFCLGQFYYHVAWAKLPFPNNIGNVLSIILGLLLGLGNVVCAQLKCICALIIPMYCGKPGRSVLKVVVLTYVIAGPITNMGLNAKEVVRVFACGTELSQNLTETKYDIISESFLQAIFSCTNEFNEVQDTIRYIRNVIEPIAFEIEDNPYEILVQRTIAVESDRTMNKTNVQHTKLKNDIILEHYADKLYQRCIQQINYAQIICEELVNRTYYQCLDAASESWSRLLSVLMASRNVCSLNQIGNLTVMCNYKNQTNPGLSEGYATLRKVSMSLKDENLSLQQEVNIIQELYDIKDAKETGDMVTNAFEEKQQTMHAVGVAVDVCMALMFLRILAAATIYHDQYLINVDHDNVYVNARFKRIDEKRRKRNHYTLLPLKKMERSKYVDVRCLEYTWAARTVLLEHVLKLLLEVVTATTFVMLDRLFYEALDVVRRHAAAAPPATHQRDMEIELEGTGALASMVRKVLDSIKNLQVRESYSNKCLPRPTSTPFYYYLKIYGGYLWILVLLYIHPYTERLRRLVCSYFYPEREKQRILHLYNDILKKRMKMQKTLRRKALRAARTHYMSGESLLGLRMKWPQLLGWLRVLPAARMTCLICGETEPREADVTRKSWKPCGIAQCPFVYCVECWREAGARCLACDAALSDLSIEDSFSDDDIQY
ncbi:hypothetical protein ACJJTC_016268 [Scirpophaga incertulas]